MSSSTRRTRKCKKAKLADIKAVDYINNLPRNIIDDIMERLPLYDAARMSTLSRMWLDIWSSVPTLSFDDEFFSSVVMHPNNPNRSLKFYSVVSKILLQHQGDILKFSLSVPCSLPDFPEFPEWIYHLSRKGVRELSIQNQCYKAFRLPLHLFSFKSLEKLKLQHCVLVKPSSVFQGFQKLTVLHLDNVRALVDDAGLLRDLIRSCPQLQTLFLKDLMIEDFVINVTHLKHLVVNGSFKSLVFRNAANLVSASLVLQKPIEPKQMGKSFRNLFQELGKSTKLEKLCFGGYFCKVWQAKGLSLAGVAASLKKVRFLRLSSLQINAPDDFSSIITTLRSFPKVEKLDISVGLSKNLDMSKLDYDPAFTFRLLRHANVKIFKTNNEELKIIEMLLGCSPILQKLSIEYSDVILMNSRLRLMEHLVRCRRASAEIEITTSSFTLPAGTNKDIDRYFDEYGFATYPPPVHAGLNSSSDEGEFYEDDEGEFSEDFVVY